MQIFSQASGLFGTGAVFRFVFKKTCLSPLLKWQGIKLINLIKHVNISILVSWILLYQDVKVNSAMSEKHLEVSVRKELKKCTSVALVLCYLSAVWLAFVLSPQVSHVNQMQ